MKRRTLRFGDNVNTDDIIPAKRCTNYDAKKLGRFAFEHLIEGPMKGYETIEAGRNFGCGSSREHAILALLGSGIRNVVADSFSDIFFRNAVNLGLNVEIRNSERCDPVLHEIISVGGLVRYNKLRSSGLASVSGITVSPRPMTIAEKILAKASGNKYVKPGQIIFANVDLAMSHDAVAPAAAAIFYSTYGKEAKVLNPGRFIFIADHFIQANDIRDDPEAIRLYGEMVGFAKKQNIRLYDKLAENEAQGICHALLPEKGLVLPGQLIVGTDSHTCTHGAFGAFATGIGTTDLAHIFAMGDFWIKVPGSCKIEIKGQMPKEISAKDVMLYILKDLGAGGAKGKVIEFTGEVIAELSIDERMTLTNMAIELGAVCGIIAPDGKTVEYVGKKTHRSFEPLSPDEGATYKFVKVYDITQLKPQIAKPYASDKVIEVSTIEELRIRINKAFIGSCTGGKLDDLAKAAAELKGKTVAPKVKLYIVPASQEIKQQAEELGYMDIFRSAGAEILPVGCGACINAGTGVLGPKEVGIFATNRNFRGRNGHETSQVYLASPKVVAISAANGYISENTR